MMNLFLHSCCAPCAAGCIDRCRKEGYEPTLFFSNSNINQFDEHEKRRAELKKLAKYFQVAVVSDVYDHASWLDAVKGHEDAAEQGSRCPICFAYSFKRTAIAAKAAGFSFFTTSLSVSPHKNSKILFSVGEEYSAFVPLDFKKQDGYKHSLEISKELNLYRQNFCACEFSMR